MTKKRTLIYLCIVVAGTGWLARRAYNGRTQVVPYPYTVVVNQEEVREANRSNILIVGDRMGIQLAPYIEEWSKEVSKELRKPLRVYNWARDNEGLHRTLAKLNKLSKLPPVIVYHGGSQEFYEDRFSGGRHYNALTKNLSLYNNDLIHSLIMLFRPLSRLIYHPYPANNLSLEPSAGDSLSDSQRQKQMGLVYQMFSLEWKEMVSLVKKNNSNLIVVTGPLNLSVMPKQVCKNSTSKRIEMEQEHIEKLLAEGKSKMALQNAIALANTTLGNAKSLYLLGKAYQSNGEIRKSKGMMYRSGGFDCKQWRGNILINKILLEKAEPSSALVVDFNQIVNQYFGSDQYQELFPDQLYPSKKLYLQVISDITPSIRKIMGI